MEQIPEPLRKKILYEMEEGFNPLLDYGHDDGVSHPIQKMPGWLFQYIVDEIVKPEFLEVFKNDKTECFHFKNGVSFYNPPFLNRFLLTTLESPKVSLETGLTDGVVLYIILIDMHSMLENEWIGKFRLVSMKDDKLSLDNHIKAILDDLE